MNNILTKEEQIKFEISSYILAAAFTFLFYKNIWLSLAGGMVGILFEDEYINYVMDKRNKKMLIQFKDLLYSISSSMATGRYMFEALKEGETYLKMIYGEDAILVKELKKVNSAIYDNHSDEEKVLIDFAVRSQIEDIKDFVDVYLTTRATGGDIQKVIASASLVIIDKMQIQREVETMMAQKQLEARIVALIPIFIILFLNIFSPDYLMPMYTTVAGRIIMTLALIGFNISFKWIIKLTEV